MKLYEQDYVAGIIDFEEESGFNPETMIISGNSKLTSYGDKLLISIINNDFIDDDTLYDYNILDELKKVSGKTWASTTIHGCVQSDWNMLYFVVDDQLKSEDFAADFDKVVADIQDFYFGLVNEYKDEDDCYYLVPHNICWDNNKEKICDYLGFSPEDTQIFTIVGYTQIPDFAEIN